MSNPKGRDLEDLSIEELRAELARREAQQRKLKTVDEMEDADEEVASRLKEAVFAERVKVLGPEDGRPKACPRCGRPVPVRTRDKKRTVRTRSGEVTFIRNYHYCRSCRFGFYPRDEELGLPRRGRLSSGLEKRILDFAINDPFAHAAERWHLHYGWSVSENLLRRVTDRVGLLSEASDARRLQEELKPAPKRRAELLVVETDGSMLPMRGDEAWKEAKLGLVVRSQHRHSVQDTGRAQITEARYVATLGGQEAFAASLSELLKVESAQRVKTVVWLGDGAPGNWRLAGKLRPGCIEVLDWQHAVEHAMTCAKVLLGEDEPLLVDWKRTCETLLLDGVRPLVSQLMDCLDQTSAEGAAAINDLIRYYRTNERRMQYSQYIANGYPIATGAIESAHRHVLQVRMKRAGQRWSPARGRRMAQLRACYRTSGPQRLHAAIRRAYAHNRVQLSANPTPRRASNR